ERRLLRIRDAHVVERPAHVVERPARVVVRPLCRVEPLSFVRERCEEAAALERHDQFPHLQPAAPLGPHAPPALPSRPLYEALSAIATRFAYVTLPGSSGARTLSR